MSDCDEIESQLNNFRVEKAITTIEKSRLIELLRIESEVKFDSEVHEMYEKMVEKNAVLQEDYNMMTQRYDKLKLKFEELQKSTDILIQNSSSKNIDSQQFQEQEIIISNQKNLIKKLELKKSELIKQNIDEVRQKEEVISKQDKTIQDLNQKIENHQKIEDLDIREIKKLEDKIDKFEERAKLQKSIIQKLDEKVDNWKLKYRNLEKEAHLDKAKAINQKNIEITDLQTRIDKLQEKIDSLKSVRPKSDRISKKRKIDVLEDSKISQKLSNNHDLTDSLILKSLQNFKTNRRDYGEIMK